jgi:hypothetical protein
MYSILFIVIFSFFSCKSDIQKKKENNAEDSIEHTIIYTSSSNGVADIKLTIDTGRLFSYYMEIIPQPMTNEAFEIIEATGTWVKKDNWILLIFDDKGIKVPALFNAEFVNKEDYIIIDNSSVKINLDKKEIPIWGIQCIKTVIQI